MYRIRDVNVKDTKRILEIYAHYVTHTAITFAYDVPTHAQFQKQIQTIIEHYPYFVIEKDGILLGYAYAAPFVGRAAYAWSCELSIYLDKSIHKNGLGRMLYEALEAKLKHMGILNLYACIAYPVVEDEYLNTNSAQFHTHLGFTKVGEFHKCGYKFDRWYNMIWMEKIIGEHKIK